MKRQGRNLIILVVVLAVLAAGYIGLKQYNVTHPDKDTGQPGEVLVNIARDDILRFSYVYEGETYSFEKVNVAPDGGDSNGTQEADGEAASTVESRWVSTADPSLNLQQSRLNTLAGKLIYIVAKSTITDVTDMSQYGLEPPANVLHWETDQKSYTYHIGDYNSFGNVYYICEPDSNTVYIVTSPLGTGFDYGMEDLVEQQDSQPSQE